MSETELHEEVLPPESELDEDDRLKPAFVSAVLEAVEAGDVEGARALVDPLHPADIADLVELTPGEQRPALVAAIGDLIDGDVLAEMNDWVREALVDALTASQVADLASELGRKIKSKHDTGNALGSRNRCSYAFRSTSYYWSTCAEPALAFDRAWIWRRCRRDGRR